MTFATTVFRRAGLVGLALVLVSALALLIVGPYGRHAPSLDGIGALIESRQFDAAETVVRQFLQSDPSNPKANLLMAQLVLDRDDQKPRLALEHLARIQTVDRRILAHVRLNQGKAYSALKWNDRAELAWKQALEFDARIPEAGWNLLSLYYVEGRRSDAHRLALSLYATEPDPHDRVRLLLELTRQDAEPITLDELIKVLEPIANARPDDRHASIALALALVRNSRAPEGLEILRKLRRAHSDDPEVVASLLLGLDEARQLEELASVVGQIPANFAADRGFDRYRAVIAQQRGDWSSAADGDFKAWQIDPSDFQVLYRLSRELRAAGRIDAAALFDQKVHDYKAAKSAIFEVYSQATRDTTLGTAPHPSLYQRLATIREQMGRDDEALEWHRLVLKDEPTNVISRAAEQRLMKAISDRGRPLQRVH